ncbi:hypothetical protein B0W47_07795 [Komagataeibacter nataicola]|uniref:Uncharacterized protein n=1 Tax=Komagataeibacter nataicola TaxID=265960 RepID=A0A9N7H145_9PROT|nr:hypothetical protein B0W47_07795 [Komagataeibacter nataicola]PYD65271.1 hypothetical protein CDI09_14525 [Komagataeibacter nataicola]
MSQYHIPFIATRDGGFFVSTDSNIRPEPPGDLIRIEPPEQLIELHTLRLGETGRDRCVTFTAADEARARALIADTEHDCLKKGEMPFRLTVLRAQRVATATSLIRMLSGTVTFPSALHPMEVSELQQKWQAFLATVLAEKIADNGEGQ